MKAQAIIIKQSKDNAIGFLFSSFLMLESSLCFLHQQSCQNNARIDSWVKSISKAEMTL
jgi:hypothetical protein